MLSSAVTLLEKTLGSLDPVLMTALRYHGFAYGKSFAKRIHSASDLNVVEFLLTDSSEDSPREEETYIVIGESTKSVVVGFEQWLNGKDSLLVYTQVTLEGQLLTLKNPVVLPHHALIGKVLRIVNVSKYTVNQGLEAYACN